MLVLSRKTGERIHIGADVFVEVRRVAGNRVTLAISAPRHIRILRGELIEAAEAFSVLDEEPASSESTTDTVIMRCENLGEPLPEAPDSDKEQEEQSTGAQTYAY